MNFKWMTDKVEDYENGRLGTLVTIQSQGMLIQELMSRSEVKQLIARLQDTLEESGDANSNGHRSDVHSNVRPVSSNVEYSGQPDADGVGTSTGPET